MYNSIFEFLEPSTYLQIIKTILLHLYFASFTIIDIVLYYLLLCRILFFYGLSSQQILHNRSSSFSHYLFSLASLPHRNIIFLCFVLDFLLKYSGIPSFYYLIYSSLYLVPHSTHRYYLLLFPLNSVSSKYFILFIIFSSIFFIQSCNLLSVLFKLTLSLACFHLLSHLSVFIFYILLIPRISLFLFLLPTPTYSIFSLLFLFPLFFFVGQQKHTRRSGCV